MAAAEPSTAINQVEEESQPGAYFNKKGTYAEYVEELKKPLEYADPHDPNDPRYYKKYAHTVAPLDAYFFVMDRRDEVSHDEKSKNDRRVFYGWNNITNFEVQGTNTLKAYLLEKGVE